ncbi:MAG: hypothetical protein ABSD74_19665 [Rhizomicrobium sp.]|jgi:hypothetical protein
MKSRYLPCVAVCAFLVAGSASARSFNCADPASRPDGTWSLDQPLSMQLVGDIQSQRLGAPTHFKYRFCGTLENGEQMILVGAMEIVDGAPKCDSGNNFGVLYDPRKRSFGTMTTGVNMCFPGTAPATPPPNPAQ